MDFVQFQDEHELGPLPEQPELQKPHSLVQLHIDPLDFLSVADQYNDILVSNISMNIRGKNYLHINKNCIKEKDDLAHHNLKQIQRRDRKNYIILGMLYLYQGLIIGFIESAIPMVLIQNGARFTQLGLLSFTSWPWSFQMLTAPIFDTYYIKKFGKRKTYLVPLQLISGLILLTSSLRINNYVETPNIFMLFLIGISLEYIYSVQDITVGGWALTLLSPENVAVASTCQNIGQTLGVTISSTVYIWLNSPKFLNQVLNTNLQNPILDPQSFSIITALFIISGTLYITFFKKENSSQRQQQQQQNNNNQENKDSISSPSILIVLKKIYGFTQNPNLRILIIFLLFSSLPTAPIDRLSDLILLKDGISREMVSTIAVFLIPIQFVSSIITTMICKKKKEFTCLLFAVVLRFFNNFFKYYITINYQHGKNDQYTIYLLYIQYIIDTVGGTIQFVTSQSFAYRMCDHDVGGSYLTMLNSLSNFGGAWAGSLVLFLLDYVPFNIQFHVSNVLCIIFFGCFSKTLINFEKSDPSLWKLKVDH